MRALVCDNWGGPETLNVREIPDPAPKPGQIVVRVHAAGVNYPDVLMVAKKYQFVPPLPFTPGGEISGEVIAIGEGVEGFALGDRVAGLCQIGAFAEQVALDANRCLKLPPGMDMAVAGGFMLVYGTSWHALRDRAALQAGETVLVLGAAGGVGLSAVEIAHAMGARVIAAASTDEKCATCLAHGADAAINYTTEDLRAGIKRLAPLGPDVIYDPVGGKFSEAAFRSIAWRGRHLVIGFVDGIAALPLNLTLLKGASAVGVFWGDYTRREPAHFRAGMDELLGWITAGRLKPLISKTYTLEEAPLALADIAARKVTGKIVILP